ncbi:MAG: hypothetical protein KDK36_16465, partial [Leptospiraceae bacterium]|nr:hypothetical protein [Leptospiraceae bacterium]
MRIIFSIFIIYFLAFINHLEAKLPKYPIGIYPAKYSQFWFLYESESRNGEDEFIIRPFYSSYQNKLFATKYKTSIYPIYYSQSTNHWSRWSFLFIFGNDSTEHPDTGEDSDLSLGGIVQWGSGETEKDKYGGIFPIYGTMKSKLSWNEINYFLFPIYVDWNHKEFKARSFLWPLFVYGKSDIRKEYRAFPIFSHKSHVGKFSHNSFLWPFFQWGKDSLDKKEPTSYSFFWLLFSKKSSYYGNMNSTGIIPVIGSMSLISYGYDKRTSQKDFALLFFLFQYGYSTDRDYSKLIAFPFYGYSRYAGKQFKFITPFFYRMKTDTFHLKANHFFLLPIFQYSIEYFPKEEREDRYIKIWPFYKHHVDVEGNLSWNALSLFPIRSRVFERVWDPIWSIVEYKRLTNGEKRFSLLMRLYTQRWTENNFYFYVPLLLDYSNENGIRSWDVLYGFLGYESSKEKSYFKFLWFFKI